MHRVAGRWVDVPNVIASDAAIGDPGAELAPLVGGSMPSFSD